MRKIILAKLALLALVAGPPAAAAPASFENARAEFGRLLRSNDAHERTLGVFALDGFDRPEAARLIIRNVLTRDDRAGVIRAGIKLLGAMKADDSVKAVVEEATKGPWEKRARVYEALGSMVHPDALDALLGGAYDEDSRVRTSAILALELSKSDRAELALSDALRAKEWPVRAAAIDVLRRRRREEAVGPLVEALAAETGRLRGDAANALRSITGEDFGVFPAAWKTWWTAKQGGSAAPLGDLKPIPPTAELAGIPTWATRVLFVLALHDSMNKKLGSSVDSAIPADVRDKGGDQLRRWREADTKVKLARLLTAWGIEHLSPEVKFDVVSYGQGADAAFGALMPATPENREKAADRIRSLSASGNANLYAGLRCVFELVSKDPVDEKSLTEGPEVVYFVSDGSADYGEIPDGYGALEQVELANRYRQIVFHSVGVGEHDSRILGTLIGFAGGGQLVAVP